MIKNNIRKFVFNEIQFKRGVNYIIRIPKGTNPDIIKFNLWRIFTPGYIMDIQNKGVTKWTYITVIDNSIMNEELLIRDVEIKLFMGDDNILKTSWTDNLNYFMTGERITLEEFNKMTYEHNNG